MACEICAAIHCDNRSSSVSFRGSRLPSVIHREDLSPSLSKRGSLRLTFTIYRRSHLPFPRYRRFFASGNHAIFTVTMLTPENVLTHCMTRCRPYRKLAPHHGSCSRKCCHDDSSMLSIFCAVITHDKTLYLPLHVRCRRNCDSHATAPRNLPPRAFPKEGEYS